MTEQNKSKDYSKKILTIPNILSFFRILLIPIIVWLYFSSKNYSLAGNVLILSGITDLVDGFIARRYNMISNFGKVLDPIADKLTQSVVIICLFIRYKLVIMAFIILTVKEIFMSVSGMVVIKKTGKVMGANWHGKLSTCLLYGMMLLHIFWTDIPQVVSVVSICLASFTVALSLVLYAVRNISAIKAI